MHAGQRERGVVVIENSVSPQHRVMTQLAGGREPNRDMVDRRRRIVVVRLVAADAGGAGNVVIAVDMAIGALTRRHGMRSRQCEAGSGMVEYRIRPQHRVMALLAGLREPRRDVVGIRRRLIIFQVATYARRGGDVVIAIDVAIGTQPRRHGVSPGKREAGRRVVEHRVRP